MRDGYEQEVEYERLGAALTGVGAEALIARLHSGQTQFDGSSKIIHLYAVAELAKHHADVFYADCGLREQRYLINVCRLTGLLHEAMACGALFEEVVSVADEVVAQSVASLTADCRLPHPKRYRLLLNQVGLAEASAQLVLLADLQHDCFYLLNLPKEEFTVELVMSVLPWLANACACVSLLDKIERSDALALQLCDLADKLQSVQARTAEVCPVPRRKR